MQKVDDHTAKGLVFEGFQQGKRKAYQQLFGFFYHPLCMYLSKMDLDSFLVEEIVQDSFLKLWDRRTDFPNLATARSFLFITSKHAALNALDKLKRQQSKADRYMQEQDWVTLPISQQMIYSETIHAIHQAIDKLPTQCRKVMQLLFVEGYTPQEVAKELTISSSTVYNQKQRGIILLKGMLSIEQFSLLLVFFGSSYFYYSA